MRRALALLLLLLLAGIPAGLAHRLDECLQAIRLQLATDRVTLVIDVTPGVAIAKEFLAGIDRDHDGMLSRTEERAYAESLLKDLIVRLDEQPLTLHLTKLSASAMGELEQGTGLVRITANADFERLAAGVHRLSLTNRHLPAISVFLVNAVKPADPRVTLRRQIRSKDQSEYRVEFHVREREP